MKIDKKDCPILLDGIIFNKLGFKKYSGGTEIPIEKIKANEDILNQSLDNVMYITNPVLEAFDFGTKETISKLISLRNEINNIKRSVIWKQSGVTTTTVYAFQKEKDYHIFTLVFQVNNKIGNINFHCSGYWKEDWTEHSKFALCGSCSVDIDKEILNKAFVNHIELIVQCEVFLQYANLDTKVLNKNSKDSIICRYHNKLPFPITIVDSTWYTNLVRSEGFKVRGHFRLQPYGEGLSKKKLIWVNDFEKNGYTLKAKKLQYEV